MRKWLTLTLTLALCLLLLVPSLALAEGKATIVQEKVFLYESSDFVQVDAFAEVQNTGDQPIELGFGEFSIYGADGAMLNSSSLYTFYPREILPGGTGFIVLSDYLSDVTDEQIADYTLTAFGRQSEGKLRSIDVADINVVTKPWYEGSDRLESNVHIVLENTGEEVAYMSTVVCGAYDAEGKLLFCVMDYQSIGVWPGSKIELRCRVSDEIVKAIGGADKIAQFTAIASVDSNL